ncbi:Hypothetical predicted protein [Cloeon dipterum]|uniref:Uncharacterized protein n=1 Tax=Cloeon dipterum TaxID=197152 RepID=A0A8S1DLW5_9INSE|nr:Hypothetical predicted protein [Cloeon dipterum]
MYYIGENLDDLDYLLTLTPFIKSTTASRTKDLVWVCTCLKLDLVALQQPEPLTLMNSIKCCLVERRSDGLETLIWRLQRSFSLSDKMFCTDSVNKRPNISTTFFSVWTLLEDLVRPLEAKVERLQVCLQLARAADEDLLEDLSHFCLKRLRKNLRLASSCLKSMQVTAWEKRASLRPPAKKL